MKPAGMVILASYLLASPSSIIKCQDDHTCWLHLLQLSNARMTIPAGFTSFNYQMIPAGFISFNYQMPGCLQKRLENNSNQPHNFIFARNRLYR
jgi:hypothetical protein